MEKLDPFLRQFMMSNVKGRGEVYFYTVILREPHERQCNDN
jgi:hypothetical protein